MRKLPFIFLFFILSVFALSNIAYADSAPKPSVQIKLTLDGKPIWGKFQARMLSCFTEPPYRPPGIPYRKTDSIFDSSKPDETDDMDELVIKDIERGCYWKTASLAWGGDCKNSVCRFGYQPPEEFKLAVKTPNGDFFITDEVDRTNFDSYYEVELNPDGSASISETTNTLIKNLTSFEFIIAIILTLIIELTIGAMFFSEIELRLPYPVTILFANFLTLSVLWYFKPQSLLLMEFCIAFTEGMLYLLIYRSVISKKRIFLFAITANLVSFLFGEFISIVQIPYLIFRTVSRIIN